MECQGLSSFLLFTPSLDIYIFVSSPGESNMQLGLQPTGQPKYTSQCVRGVKEKGGWHANQWFTHLVGVQQVFPRDFLSEICPGLIQVLWMEGHRHSWCFSVLKDCQSCPMTSEKMHLLKQNLWWWEWGVFIIIDFNNQTHFEIIGREAQSSFSRKDTLYLSFLSWWLWGH